LLRETVARRLALAMPPGADGIVSGVGGTRVLRLAVSEELRIGSATGYAISFGLVADSTLPAGADGLLAMDYLGAYDIDFDTAGSRMVLVEARGNCALPTTSLPPPLFVVPMIGYGNDVQAFIAVTIRGQHFRALIDTGAANTTLFGHAARALGLTRDAVEGDPQQSIRGIGFGRFPVTEHVVPAMRIGDLTIRNMNMLVTSFWERDMPDMLLGFDFVRLVHVWISHSSQSVVLQYPPRASPAALGKH
jgi:hypothetical protein